MKKILSLALALILLAGAGVAQTPTVAKWNALTTTGRLIASGSYSWGLVALQADADSSVASTMCDITGASRLPGYVIFSLQWTGCTGQLAGTTLQVRAYVHYGSGDTVGLNAATANTINLATWITATASPLVVTTGATASGTSIFFPSIATLSTPTMPTPRYMSFVLDKEGSTGKYTAGTATLYWQAYAP